MEMENGNKTWRFTGNDKLIIDTTDTIGGTLYWLRKTCADNEDERPLIPLSNGDPAIFPCFRTSLTAESAVVDALQSAKFNTYCPFFGMLPARRAVAEYLSVDLPYEISPDDVYMTLGCTQAIEVIVTVLATPGANILLPKPGFPTFEARCDFSGLEYRHFELLPDRGWEMDLDAIESLADENTVAIVIINPGSPCGVVFSYDHLKKVAEIARKLGIVVISDEVYEHLTFGETPFVRMGIFGSIVPVITLGSLSKRWAVPAWRMGWLATCDPCGVLRGTQMRDQIMACLSLYSDPATFIQAALPQILQDTEKEFFAKCLNLLRQGANILYDRMKEIPCFSCPQRPEGAVFAMVRLDSSLLEDIDDDVEFCFKLAKEESVILVPGVVVGVKNWLRFCYAIDTESLEDGIERIKSFCRRHAKQNMQINDR
ncbi:tyrosine aminotransferase [Striga asiatica]|uniref:Tyrosine aminotransferase n=1 Tax=Striga asiatica TaxID=4170 RepID=A0A5A7Q716_STRAF|nr:tyrosine aminotransferase [Striga asiatica]